ncbi:MAG: hypothetical protein A49_03630 [Methyloceanibacter sp.]|nr:MAG: hypothetical protein A49_03630 [Methyloceanibacter sp.]
MADIALQALKSRLHVEEDAARTCRKSEAYQRRIADQAMADARTHAQEAVWHDRAADSLRRAIAKLGGSESDG